MAWGNSKKGKQSNEVQSAGQPVPKQNVVGQDTQTVIAQGVKLTGTLEAEGDMLVAGRIEGEITCKQKIIVSETGVIKGKVVCKSAIILGTVEGNIQAQDQLTIEETGKLIGDITTKTFNNRPGGFFEGYSHMVKEKPGGGGQRGGRSSHKPQIEKTGKEGKDS